MSAMTRSKGLNLVLIAVVGVCVAMVLISRNHADASDSPRLAPVTETPSTPELALLMSDLQRLTHKLALSADAGNAELTAFYLHESLEQLQTIQREAPEYERLPVALLIDRMALPAYEPFKAAVAAKPANREQMLKGLDAVIVGCNSCHVATQHGFLRITRGTEVNPFNQSFKP